MIPHQWLGEFSLKVMKDMFTKQNKRTHKQQHLLLTIWNNILIFAKRLAIWLNIFKTKQTNESIDVVS